VRAFADLYRRLESATSTRAKQTAMVEAFAAARGDPSTWGSAAWMVSTWYGRPGTTTPGLRVIGARWRGASKKGKDGRVTVFASPYSPYSSIPASPYSLLPVSHFRSPVQSCHRIPYSRIPDSRKRIDKRLAFQVPAALAAARKDIAAANGANVHLFLHVKVREHWLDDLERYRAMGLEFPKG
jgi:hypothetical protein